MFERNRVTIRKPSIWMALYCVLTIYVVWRLQGIALWHSTETSQGTQVIPNTFASVDHPFHVARAATLWQELSSGQLLRWIGQHQGGYPVEFYPLGQAWMEVAVRAVSFATLPPEGAHTLTVIVLFLLPGAAFAALARIDAIPQSVALLALSLQVALPGGWYGGGYTELVQWGLVTNVAGATSAILTLPAMCAAISGGSSRAIGLASGLSAIALYCNPRSAIGLVAIGVGALVAAILTRNPVNLGDGTRRLLSIAACTGLLSAPLLMSLIRFSDLYQFVHYSKYSSLTDYLSASRDSVSLVVLIAGIAGMLIGLMQHKLGMRATAVSAVVYIGATMSISIVPGVAAIVPQLEPTRLMPLQRFLLLYLAAALMWMVISVMARRIKATGSGVCDAVLVALSVAIIVFLTRPLFANPPDPASPVVPPVSLYPVAMSAQPQQFDLETAIRAGDRAADPSTAILVLGSELSWHQQLWSPLWTRRPLYYDNWLWFWHFDHTGTPGYQPRAGHHYPDPEAALTRDYIDRNGIGAVVTSKSLRDRAERVPFLNRIADGDYTTYLVENPSPIVTFENAQTETVAVANSAIHARSERDSNLAKVRLNWFPRWSAGEGAGALVERNPDGTLRVSFDESKELSLVYAVQPLDWLARVMAASGVILISWPVVNTVAPGHRKRSIQSPRRGDA